MDAADGLDPERVSQFLVDRGYLLTALEFYAELCESGTQLKSLHDFFSNASNFERQQSATDAAERTPNPTVAATRRRMHNRTPSVDSTTDDTFSRVSASESVDIIREKDEMITVLEYELRQAQDTIDKLRARLTAATSSSGSGAGTAIPSAPPGDRKAMKESVKPLEARTLTYLVNEFLVDSRFRMSAIALADENADQDLADWKDVGLDIAAPPPLVQLLRAYLNYNEAKTGKTREADLIRRLEDDNDTLRAKVARLEQSIAATASAQVHQQKELAETAEAVASKPAPATQLQLQPAAGADWEPAGALTKARRHLPIYRLLERVTQPPPPLTRLDVEVARVARGEQTTVMVVGRSLPVITPSVLLAHRQELLPMILTTIKHHPDPPVRDQLTNLLFNLFKKPDDVQRAIIMRGCIALARSIRPERVEAELLPQIWEQVAHKYTERRVLVAESCGSLAPYVKPELRGSLMLSILQQMADDKTDAVRAAVVKQLAILVSYLDRPDDHDRFTTIRDISLRLMHDPVPEIEQLAVDVLLPVLAQMARGADAITDRLVGHVTSQLESALTRYRTPSILDKANFFDVDTRAVVEASLRILAALTRHLATHVLAKASFFTAIKADVDAREAARPKATPKPPALSVTADADSASEPLGDDSDDDLREPPRLAIAAAAAELDETFFGSVALRRALLERFASFLGSLDEAKGWPEYDWVTAQWFPALVRIVGSIDCINTAALAGEVA